MTQNQKPKIDTGSFLETKLSNLCLMLQFKLNLLFQNRKKIESLRGKNFRSQHQRAEAASTYVAPIFNFNEELSYYLEQLRAGSENYLICKSSLNSS